MKYKRILFLLLIPISFILTQISKHNIYFAEFYAVKIYPIFSFGIGRITSLVPFSIAENLILFLVAVFIIYLINITVKTIKYKSSRYIKFFIINILSAASIIYFLFVLFCGINYYRNEFTVYSGLEIKESSKDELIELCNDLIINANELKQNINKDKNGGTLLFDDNYYETSKRAKKSFNNISQQYEILKGHYVLPKPVKLSREMSYTRITGVFFPFTFESNVNVDIPDYQIPSTMCHELIHQKGFMREDEANFISYLACVNSGYDDFAYSGTMLALTYSMNALYKEDYEAFENLYAKYSDGVLNDLKISNDYWKQFETKTAEISNKVNDTYLKANNQEDGVKSYGRMVDLLLSYYR
jgi:hypothetical protein